MPLEFTAIRVLGALCLTWFLYSLFAALNNITLHPLSKIPGPRLRAAFHFPFVLEIWDGNVVRNWHALHEKYGNVVRISPTYVSFISPDAWRDIYGQSAGKKALPKDPDVNPPTTDGVADIIFSNDADHARIRRLFGYGLSPQALQRQESIIQTYITTLITKLEAKTKDSPAVIVDVTRWFNFTTFDIIGDLCFGSSFDALESENYHFWISNLFENVKFFRLFRVLRAYPLVGVPVLKLVALFPALHKARQKHMQYTQDRTTRRLDDDQTTREDIMSHVLRYNDTDDTNKSMTRAEIVKTNRAVIIAGSETSATLLSGATFLLLTHCVWLARLVDEIRSRFDSHGDITFASLADLEVLNAVVQESFRMFPPVPTSLARRTPPQGAVIDGVFVAGNVSVGVPQYAANMSSRNFKDPEVFAPERWLGGTHADAAQYADDKLGVVQPFSVGPRNCLGQGLAMAEIRTVLANMVWHFDMELDGRSEGWSRQKVFILWDKRPLLVRLERVRR